MCVIRCTIIAHVFICWLLSTSEPDNSHQMDIWHTLAKFMRHHSLTPCMNCRVIYHLAKHYLARWQESLRMFQLERIHQWLIYKPSVEYVINLPAKLCLARWQESLCFNLLERIHQWLTNPLKLKHPGKFLYATDSML